MNIINDNSTDYINDLLSNYHSNFNLDLSKKIKVNKLPRKRQDTLNRASKKYRVKKTKLFILMQNHIDKLHNILNNNIDSNINSNIIIMINNFNEEVKKIKDQ